MLLKTTTPLTASSAVPAALSFVMMMAALLPCVPAYANTIAPSEQVVLSASAEDDDPPQVPLAEETEEGAIAAAKAHLAVHNEHDLERVMKFYAGDATFQLSNGRELVSGRENIPEGKKRNYPEAEGTNNPIRSLCGKNLIFMDGFYGQRASIIASATRHAVDQGIVALAGIPILSWN